MSMIEVIEKLRRQMSRYQYVYIYGAGFRAKILTGILLSEMKELCFSGVVVTDRKSAKIDFCWNIPIFELKDVYTPSEETLFLIETVDIYRSEISMELRTAGYINFTHISEKEFLELKSQYVAKRYESYFDLDLRESQFEQTAEEVGSMIKMYMVRSEKDKQVKTEVSSPDIITIQGGSAISSKKIAELRDDTGINISQKNRQFNEFTVIYWLWKNAIGVSDYIGLCHYRRIFDLNNVREIIKNRQPDIIIAEPEVLFPSIEEHYCSMHFTKDFNLMKDILQKRYPEYFKFAEKYFSQELFIPYNMMIAKERVFVQYAKWIFPLLEEIEEKWKPHGDAYEDRAPAFLGEWLTGVFILYNGNRLKLSYSKIKILETR